MKKFCVFISVLLIFAVHVSADVSVKKLGDGNIEVTFFYGNPRAQEVVLAGDFTDWQNGALPMTKGEKGWTYVRIVPPGTVMKYKFISDGNWTEDLREPDKVDDGFGGHNGLVDVDVLVAAQSKSENAAAGASAKRAGNLKFSTWGMLGYQMKWGDGKKDTKNDLDSAGLNLTSYLKISGEALPRLPIYIEVALAEQKGFDNLYKRNVRNWDEGWKNLLVDTIFDPIYYYGGQDKAKSYLGHLKMGLNTPIVNWTTGYKYAKLSPHQNVNWNTIDKEWEAGYNEVGGFNQFDFAPLFAKLLADTGVEADVVIAPNRSADRAGSQYGMYAYGWSRFNIADFPQYIDLQYNGAYGKTYDTIFKEVMEHDIIFGYQGMYGPVTVKANALWNRYGSYDNGDGTKTLYAPATSDVGLVHDENKNFGDNSASNVNVSYSSDTVKATVGYRYRGIQANMMYVEQGADDHSNITDQLGFRNTQVIFGGADVMLLDNALTVGLDAQLTMVFNKDNDYYYDEAKKFNNKDTALIKIKPRAAYDFNPYFDFPAKLDGYIRFDAVTKSDDEFVRKDKSAFIVAEAGVRYNQTFDTAVIKGLTATYAFDNLGGEYVFNTLSADVSMLRDIVASCGIGVRTEGTKTFDDILNPFAFFIGARKKLNVAAIYKPTAYCYVLAGMDPFKEFNDGPTAYRYNTDSYTWYRNTDDRKDYDGETAIRIGLVWDL